MLRISSSGVMQSYRSNLMRTRSRLEEARQTASDFLKFRNFSSDPAAASRSFQLIRNYGKTQNYIDNCKTVEERLGHAWEVALDMNTTLDKVDSAIADAMNGKDLDSRELAANTIRGQMESLVQNLNAKYNDDFVFAGQVSGEAPFTLDEDYNLYYRGVNVDTGFDKNGQPYGGIPDATQIEESLGITGKNWTDLTPDEQSQYAMKQLEGLSNEKLYIDVGLGMKGSAGSVGGFEDSNDINSASAVNVSFPGINVVGFGKDADGKPNNIISQLRDICNELEKDPMDNEVMSEMRNRFQDSRQSINKSISSLDTTVAAVKANNERLTKNADTLYEQISDLTTVDPAYAYMDYTFAQYYYNSALKIGNGILDQSFIDYMR